MKGRGKLKGRGGFSLAECLVALLILSIMSMTACMGISNAMHNRAQSIAVANAQTVASTAAQAVADQIRYGQIEQVDSDSVVLTSSTYGPRVRLKLDDLGHLVVQGDGGAGAPVYALLGEKAYGGLAVDNLAFEARKTGDRVDSVRITLSVDSKPASAGDSTHLWSLSYSVAPLNTGEGG